MFAANAFSLLGLRQLFFLIDGLLDRLVYLAYGLAVILGFIGAKLVIHALHTNELPFINGGEHVTAIPEISTAALPGRDPRDPAGDHGGQPGQGPRRRSADRRAHRRRHRPPAADGACRPRPRDNRGSAHLVHDRDVRGAHRPAARPTSRSSPAVRTSRRSRRRPSGSASTWPWPCSSALVMLRGDRRGVRHGVLRGLADRVLAVGRQPLRLRDHHGPLPGAPEAAAGSPDGRDHHRAGAARACSSCSAPR